MKYRGLRVIVTALLFLAVLTSIRLLWIYLHKPAEQHVVMEGVIDLRDVEFTDGQTVLLNGEWEFHPTILLTPGEIHSSLSLEQKEYMQVPYKRGQALSDKKGTYTFGTYRLRLLVNEPSITSYGIRIPEIQSAFRLYVNGELLGERGLVSEKREEYVPKKQPLLTTFFSDEDSIELLLHVSNATEYMLETGIRKPIVFGTAATVEWQRSFSVITEITTSAILFIHLLYVILLFVIGIRQRVLVSFSLLLIFTILTILIDDERLLLSLIPMNWDWSARLLAFFYIGASLFLIQFVKDLFPEYSKSWFLKVFSVICGASMPLFIFLPIEYIMQINIIFSLIMIITPLLAFVLILRQVLKGRDGSLFLLLGAISVASSIVWGSIKSRNGIVMGYYPFDILASIVALSAYWFKGYLQTTIEVVKVSEQLRRANDQKDDFLANTSHELRNPLHGIMAIAQTVLEKERDNLDKENKENLNLLITIGNHMSFLLNDLIDLIRLKENSLRIQKRNIKIQAIARGVCDMLRFSVEGKPIQLLVDIDEDFPTVVADENRLIQILFNLVHNAVKYTDEGTITIHASVKGKQVSITVEDTGIGMDLALQKRVFDRYEQHDSSITTVGGGLGIGLSISKELIELHGGNLTVSSVVGQGSTFTFTLPLSSEQSISDKQENPVFPAIEDKLVHPIDISDIHSKNLDHPMPRPQAPTLITTNRPRVLVVDDDPINLQVIVHALAMNDYDLETALNGKDALEKIYNGTWDLLITDVMMPHMSGYELARTVRERFKITELPILFLTARTQREDISTAFISGANDYVTKPVDTIELKARVQALIHLKQSIKERFRIEAAWLQAQINPHFFFNILNSIHILSETDEPKMRKLLIAFSDYLQASFDFQNTELVVPLEYELNLVRSYLSIEQIRFGDRIQISWDIDETIQLTLPPLSIQTLVENAIQHGLLTKAKGGEIQIRIIDNGDHFHISIRDDGVGCDEGKLLTESRERGGVGIPNTNLRLLQLYGTGLHIVSQPGQGTTISFRIPKGDNGGLSI